MTREGMISGSFAGVVLVAATLVLFIPTPLQNTGLDQRGLDQLMVGVADRRESFTTSFPLPGFDAADEEKLAKFLEEKVEPPSAIPDEWRAPLSPGVFRETRNPRGNVNNLPLER
ncbi:MAG: hypothetical protein Q7S26_01150 [bacterium]|nr:hypothetical protein [bacterium]